MPRDIVRLILPPQPLWEELFLATLHHKERVNLVLCKDVTASVVVELRDDSRHLKDVVLDHIIVDIAEAHNQVTDKGMEESWFAMSLLVVVVTMTKNVPEELVEVAGIIVVDVGDALVVGRWATHHKSPCDSIDSSWVAASIASLPARPRRGQLDL